MAGKKKPSKKQAKVAQVMHEFKAGKLNTGMPGPGRGPVVTNRKQAVAIALSEASRLGKKKRGKKK